MSFVADNKICFNLQGLRFFNAVDRMSTYGDKKGEVEYSLFLQYRGSERTIYYDTKEDRDKVYNLAVENLRCLRVTNEKIQSD